MKHTTLDTDPYYNPIHRTWEIDEIDEDGCVVFSYDFDSEVKALDFVEDWQKVTNK